MGLSPAMPAFRRFPFTYSLTLSVLSPIIEFHLLYDSHMLLLRVNEHEVVPQLLVDLINSSFGQKQVEICKSAQATKQTELGIKNAKKILFPLPELSLQNEISAVVQEKKQQIRALQSNAEKLRQYAKKEFEKAVFGSI